ncbi:trypsin-like serine peptidase [Nonomuraea sp. NPDC050383]|uniref:trypsin-like serine peptidase n=1 Tax=Nonomuraea sp. NPDC050383 TaxID=3364362 RepID=UPI003787FF58
MKRLLVPLAVAGLSAAALAAPATATPTWASDPLSPKPADAYSAAYFWLDANGAALKKATEFRVDAKDVPKLVRPSTTSADGKPGMAAPTGTTGAAAKTKNVNLPKTIGKVFFLDRGGDYRWCSATSIRSRNRNLVATAGHCVYEQGKDVFSKWVFVPGYYQGKAPFGVYAGAYAFTAYDLDVYDDYDGDFAFVAVHNGFSLAGEKTVTKAEYDKWAGDKWIKREEISAADFGKCLLNLGTCWSEGEDKPADKVGPDYPGAVVEKDEVGEEAYKDARTGKGNGYKFGEPETALVTKPEYDAYKGVGKKAEDARGNYTITRFYTQKWVKPGTSRQYYKGEYVIGLAKDAGRLGDVVGGQGVAWNQPMGQKVTVFGYPSAPHPDGDRPFTGLTPKVCSGKSGTKTYQVNMFKVETHQVLKCSMTGGSDGAPWLLRYDNNKRTGYLNGVTSLFHDQDGNDRIDFISSAYFDGEVADVYNKANYAATKTVVGPNGELIGQ